jgi:predicted peptidase
MVRILFVLAMLAAALPAQVAFASASAKSAATFTDVPTPPAPAQAAAPKDTPRNDKPMDDYTKSYMKKDFVVEGSARHDMTYWWRQPDKIDASQVYPLVIVLHDERGTATAAEYLLSKATHDAFPTFIAVPMLPPKKIWAFPTEYPDDPVVEQKNSKSVQALPDVFDLIKDIEKNFPVDPQRIYVVGCGDGGFGAYGAVYAEPTMFAAAIPINGGWTQKQTAHLARSKTAFYVLHGADDKTYSSYLDSITATYIQQFKGNVHFAAMPGLGHECSDPHLYSSILWKWMFSQKRAG